MFTLGLSSELHMLHVEVTVWGSRIDHCQSDLPCADTVVLGLHEQGDLRSGLRTANVQAKYMRKRYRISWCKAMSSPAFQVLTWWCLMCTSRGGHAAFGAQRHAGRSQGGCGGHEVLWHPGSPHGRASCRQKAEQTTARQATRWHRTQPRPLPHLQRFQRFQRSQPSSFP